MEYLKNRKYTLNEGTISKVINQSAIFCFIYFKMLPLRKEEISSLKKPILNHAKSLRNDECLIGQSARVNSSDS